MGGLAAAAYRLLPSAEIVSDVTFAPVAVVAGASAAIEPSAATSKPRIPLATLDAYR